MKTILFIYGTRPEAIKMAPLIREFKKHQREFDIKVCLTGQHREMLDQINHFFRIDADYDLNLMQPKQTLFDITTKCLIGLDNVLSTLEPDLVFVQGDTTTVMAGALAAFYKHIKIAHLEAGLRSGDLYSPFPEEGNRIITGHIANFHFAPTNRAVENLKKEYILNNVYMVGNTVIDALHLGLGLIKDLGEEKNYLFFKFLDFTKKIVLITGHRRENFGEGFENICSAIKILSNNHPEVQFVYPMHFNPNVREPVNRLLKNQDNIFLIEPLDYPYLIWLLEKCYFVLTDSGGIQEEAPTLGKPVLVMRDVTERQEGVEAGTAKLVGTDIQTIVSNAEQLFNNPSVYSSMSNAVNPYGDGSTSKQIVEIVKEIMK